MEEHPPFAWAEKRLSPKTAAAAAKVGKPRMIPGWPVSAVSEGGHRVNLNPRSGTPIVLVGKNAFDRRVNSSSEGMPGAGSADDEALQLQQQNELLIQQNIALQRQLAAVKASMPPPTSEEVQFPPTSPSTMNVGSSDSANPEFLVQPPEPGQIVSRHETTAKKPQLRQDSKGQDDGIGEDEMDRGKSRSKDQFVQIKDTIRNRPARASSSIGLTEDGLAAQIDLSGTPRQKLQAIVSAPKFELFFSVLIMANTIIMAFQVQYRGLETGYMMPYFGRDMPADNEWPGAAATFSILEWVFGVIFTLELIMKLLALDIKFVKDPYNVLDTVVVLAWFIDTLGTSMPLDPMLLRLLRLIKLLRMLRLIRAIQGFDSLYIMITSIRGSFSALGWSILFLLVVLCMIALVLCTLMESYILDDANPMDRREEVFKFYGTFSYCVLTMFELTLANWIPASRVLTEFVNEGYIIFVLAFKASIGFSVVKVLMGVFLQVTFHVAANDDMIMVNDKERSIRTHTKKMKLLFDAADEDGSGRLDSEEFMEIINDPTVIKWLGAMGFEAAHFNAGDVFELLAGGKEDISAEELVRGVSRLKGPATSLNLSLIQRDHNTTRGIVKELGRTMKAISENLGVSLAEEFSDMIEKIEAAELEAESEHEEDLEPVQESRRISERIFDGPLEEEDPEALARMNAVQQFQHKLLKIVNGFWFEIGFAALIMLNICIMAAQIEYRGLENGHLLYTLSMNSTEPMKYSYQRFSEDSKTVWPAADDVNLFFEYFFGAVFSVELVMKLLALSWRFFKEVFNILDFVIVGVWWMETMSSASLPLDPMLLRLFRLVKLMRMVRLVKIFEKYDALYLMITSIKGSVAALLWSSILLLVVQTTLSLLLSTVLEDFMRSDDQTTSSKALVYKYYGTFTRSMLTMFEITLGNWVPVTRSMMTNVSDFYVVFALLHKFFLGFAVVMVITGVFIRETVHCAQTDNTIMLNQMERSSKLHVKKMTVLFAVADEDGSGRLDEDEFAGVCADPAVKMWLGAMGVDVSDAVTVHRRICDHLGLEDLNAKEFVKGMALLKGEAKNMAMALLRKENGELLDMVTRLTAQMQQISEKKVSRSRVLEFSHGSANAAR